MAASPSRRVLRIVVPAEVVEAGLVLDRLALRRLVLRRAQAGWGRASLCPGERGPPSVYGVFAPLAERRAATSTSEVREGARGYWITGLSKSGCGFAATKTTVGGKGFKLEEHWSHHPIRTGDPWGVQPSGLIGTVAH